MNEEELQQRIRYLIEHGGLYPPERDRWPPWVWLLLAISALGALGHLLK